MKNNNSILLVLSNQKNEIIKYDLEGNLLGRFAAIDQNLQPMQLVKSREGFIYVFCKLENSILKFNKQGDLVYQFNCSSAYSFDKLAVDSRLEFYAISTSNDKLIKFDETGNCLAEANITCPNNIFLSRISSNEKYVGAYNNASGKFSIFLTHDLSLFVEQYFEKDAAAFLNSEIVNPKLVYVTYPNTKKVVTYKDYGGGFHLHNTYELTTPPLGMDEGEEGIVVFSSDSLLYMQCMDEQPFTPITVTGLSHPLSIVVIEGVS